MATDIKSYGRRFPTVRLLDENGHPTGLIGQAFGKMIDSDGKETGKVAVMLTAGGQGCRHWPTERLEVTG